MNVKLRVSGKFVPIKLWKFPAGEVGVKIEDIEAVRETDKVFIFLNDASSDSIMAAINLANAVDQICPGSEKPILFTKYLPYSRQDRVCHEGESFALEVFIRLLSQHFSWIYTLDVHSNVSELISKNYGIVLSDIHQAVCAQSLPVHDYFVAPDAGASAKIDQHYQVEFGDTKVVQLSKTRKDGKVIYDDLKSGTLSGKVCVVDDLGDGMTTFVSLGEMLRRTQPDLAELSLYITHGLFTNPEKFEQCCEIYNTIYVHNLMNESYKNHGKVVTI